MESAFQRLNYRGLISCDNKSKYPKSVTREITGKHVADKEGKDLDDEIINRLPEYIDLFEGLEHDEMLAFVDVVFPEMAEKSSRYQLKIKPHIQNYIVNLIRK
ncbi:MAG: hypothetical protein MPJ02_08290 [Nitrosopumilus sp.]|nr:hypothetical protein [Nitrosopumilus sp.]MDA7999555.1 hypothetical protein [Nitrosopumilus sp.]